MAETKHMEFLQTAIGRMAANSFLAKGWSVTLGTALLGLAIKDGARDFALLGLLPVALFWILDAYYLALEKSFRQLFKTAAGATTQSYDMNASATFTAVLAAMFRPAVLMIHLTILVCLVATVVMTGQAT